MEPPPDQDRPLPLFTKKCMHCNTDQQSISYVCKDSEETWQDEYRSYDLKLNLTANSRSSIIKSFENYEFDHQQGILQYRGLPHRNRHRPDDLQVGLTPLYHLAQLGSELGAEVYIKSEGHNPSGCFKDRETMMCLLNTRTHGLSRAVIYSSGNAAGSAAIFAQKNKIHLVTFVSGDTYIEKIDFIRAHGSEVIVIGDQHTSFEEGYRLFSKLNAMDLFAHCGYDNWSVVNPYRVEGDKTTAVEIVKQLSEGQEGLVVPAFVVVPTANGTCLAGIWKGFKELQNLGIIAELPRMVSAGIKGANPVCKAVEDKHLETPSRCDLSLVEPADADIGSIIVAEEGYDTIEAAKAVIESGGLALEVTKSDIVHYYQLFLERETSLAKDENIMPEPASIISIAAIGKIANLQPHTKVVSVVTGSGLKARKKITEILPRDQETTELVDRILQRKRKLQYPDAPNPGSRINVAPQAEEITHAFNKLKK